MSKWFEKFPAGDSRWIMLHGQADQLKLTAIKLRHQLEQSTLYHTGESRHPQNTQVNKVTGENEKCVLFYSRS